MSIRKLCRRLKWHLLLVATMYVASFALGYAAIAVGHPYAISLRRSILETVAQETPFTTVTSILKARNLAGAIVFTFLVNLVSGAFLSTTFIGVIPLLGAGAVAMITIYRGVSLGVVYYAVLNQSLATFMVGAGTLILELGGYVFSGAAGIALSLATAFPKWQGTESRWTAFKRAWRNTATIYIIVATLLLAGAVWEMTGLFLLTR
jgi:hypothetical protein